MISKLISFESITLSFFENDGLENIVFDSLNLDIYSQKVYRLVGENGSGKSSLIKLIKGIYRPDVGRVTISDGIRFFCPNFEEIPLNIRVKDYLSFYSALTPEIISLLSLEDVLKLKIDSLSTGEKQRIALVPLFVEQYDMLIFDESFKYIDEDKRKAIAMAIEHRYFGKSAIIFVEHEVEDLFDYTDVLLIENKGIKHTKKVVDRIEATLDNSNLKKHRQKYCHLLKSHFLIYPLVFIFIALLQLAPGLMFSSFFPVNKARPLPVTTLKAVDGVVSEDVLKKLESFEKVKYSLEYTLNPKLYDPNLLSLDNRLADDEVNVTDVVLGNIYEDAKGLLSYNTIVLSRLYHTSDEVESNFDPILKIKKIFRRTGRRYHVSKKNYIILNQMINLYEKFYLYSSAPAQIKNIYQLIVTQRHEFPLAIMSLKGLGELEYPSQMTFVHAKEEKDSISLPIVRVPEQTLIFPSIEMNLAYLESFVFDETYVSLVVNNKKEFTELKNIAIAHGLVVYTNYTGGYKYDPIKVTTNLAVWSLTILANVTIFLYPINLSRRKYELLIEGKLKGRGHLLILGTTFVTIAISIISILIMKNWLFPLINVALYMVLMAAYFYYSVKRGDKHAKI